jgi:Ca-activated chloride channel family protein
MKDGILEALKGLRAEAQRQVVVITDGQIGFEQEIVGEILNRLPSGSRVHTVGVGSAVNRSLTGPAARAGRGVEAVVGIGEDPERAAKRLVARTAAPLVVDVAIEGDALVETAPAKMPDLYAGAPVLASLRVRAEGGSITVRGRTPNGEYKQTVSIAASKAGEGFLAAAQLFAREKVEDLETRAAAGEKHDNEIERLGLEHQIATRLTSWVAISEEPTVDPSSPTRRERMPQELPHGQSMEGLGLRGGPPVAMAMPMAFQMAAPARASMTMTGAYRGAPPPAPGAPPPPAMRARLEADEAPAPAQEEKAKSEGFFSRMKKKLGFARDLVLKGRVVLKKADELHIEITATEDLDWSPGAEVTVTLDDGTTATVQVIGGTRAGRVNAGDTIRLSLRTAANVVSLRAGACTIEL